MLALLFLACAVDQADPCATTDGDGDGFPLCAASGVPADCDDYLAWVRPGAPEQCDGIDDDCDGEVPADEVDADGDGAFLCGGDCDAADPLLNLRDDDGDGWTTCELDCDDTDAFVRPGAPERCDGQDQDCDGRADEHDGAEDATCADTDPNDTGTADTGTADTGANP